jgi:branched-chain amino acid transport system permease protein
VVAIAVMLKAPKGIWGLIADRFGWQLLPLERRLVVQERVITRPRSRSGAGSSG